MRNSFRAKKQELLLTTVASLSKEKGEKEKKYSSVLQALLSDHEDTFSISEVGRIH